MEHICAIGVHAAALHCVSEKRANFETI